MEQKEMAKTRLIIYVLMAYGLTCLMGILMWYGSTKGYDLTVFPTAQMMYPAAGVIIGFFSGTQRRENPASRFFYYGSGNDGCPDRIGTFIRISAGK